MKFSPRSTVPAGTLDLTVGAAFADTASFSEAVGVSGVLNGCAAEVEIAAGWPSGRAFVAVVVCVVTACAGRVAVREKERAAGVA